MHSEFDPRISPCTEEAVMSEQERLIADGSMDADKPLPYDEIVATDFIEGLLADERGPRRRTCRRCPPTCPSAGDREHDDDEQSKRGGRRPGRRPPTWFRDRTARGSRCSRRSVWVTSTRCEGPTVTALEDVNLTIREGDFVTIVGPSGCGKSTLASMFAGLIKPTPGSGALRREADRGSVERAGDGVPGARRTPLADRRGQHRPRTPDRRRPQGRTRSGGWPSW